MANQPDMTESPRLQWYNPKLDARTICAKMTESMARAVIEGKYDDGSAKNSGPLNMPDDSHPANLVSSLCEDGRHRPALDIDMPYEGFASVKLRNAIGYYEGHEIVKSASGNVHLYLPNLVLSWPEYVKLLALLVSCGFVESKYLHHSVNRGQTLLRLPGIPKTWEQVRAVVPDLTSNWVTEGWHQ